MIELLASGVREVAAIGAHCDDIAIGIGGTLLTLTARATAPTRVHVFVIAGEDSRREIEERRAERHGGYAPHDPVRGFRIS